MNHPTMRHRMPRFLGFVCLASALAFAAHTDPVVNESARPLPLVYEADVAIAGGGTEAVAAAVAAAESGA